MFTGHLSAKLVLMFSALGFSLFPLGQNVLAHCDTLDGPVVKAARMALEKGEVSPVLKWVRSENEKEIREAFQKTLAVRARGGEAKELADMYFFETLVRLHRAGEGEPYTGLKPGEGVDPAVALADQALEGGSADQLVEVLTRALAQGLRERFQRARETGRRAEDSVAAGREFVEAYVVFTHYAEALHAAIQADAGRHLGEDQAHGGSAH